MTSSPDPQGDNGADEPAAPSKARKRRRSWAWLPLIAVLCLASAVGLRTYKQSLTVARAPVAEELSQPQAAPSQVAPPPVDSASSWTVKHNGHVPLTDGVLLTPKSFTPTDGNFDLVIHFHGDVGIVKESIEHAKVNAALAVINVGIRSAPYRNAFQQTGRFEKLLAQIRHGLIQRGVANPKLSRLALTSWSAGYGATESILEHRLSPPVDEDPLDAIIALDGVHAGFVDEDPKRIKERTLQAFLNAARAAAGGQLLMIMTHSEIDPIEYASAQRSQLYLLDKLGISLSESPILPIPPHLRLAAAAGAVAPLKEQRMVPKLAAHAGKLHVLGYGGVTREHHAAHLTQMAAVALPDLAKRWAKPADKPAGATIAAKAPAPHEAAVLAASTKPSSSIEQ